MPRGDKSSYGDKQKRQAEHIEESAKKKGRSTKTAERIAWATVNKQTGGVKKTARKKTTKKAAKKSTKKAAKKGARKTTARKSTRKSTARKTARKSTAKKAAKRGGRKTAKKKRS